MAASHIVLREMAKLNNLGEMWRLGDVATVEELFPGLDPDYQAARIATLVARGDLSVAGFVFYRPDGTVSVSSAE